jgi:hypothetical protein
MARLAIWAALGALIPGSATAADLSTATSKALPAWTDTLTAGVQFEAGILGNPANPSDGQNFGQLYSDHANSVMLNQILVTIQRPLDPAATGYDFGFMLQGMYGTDARYNHVLGVDDYLLNGRAQLVPTGIYGLAHLPWLTPGGVDLKAGLTGGEMGYEALDPSVRPFYTYSYISNYLLPFQHIGAFASWHVNGTLDLYAGIDAGSQTSPWEDNNSLPAGYFGFGLNKLLNGKLGILAMSRLGPEDPLLSYPNANSLMRSWNDIVATYTATDKLSFVSEANFFYDAGLPNNTAYGAAGYVAYVLTDQVTINARAEVMRDNTGEIVGNWIGADSFTNSLRGLYSQFETASAPTTYGELTFNIVYKPKVDLKSLGVPIKTLQLRPEIRYDRSLNGTTPFNAGHDQDAFMIGGDIVLGF